MMSTLLTYEEHKSFASLFQHSLFVYFFVFLFCFFEKEKLQRGGRPPAAHPQRPSAEMAE